MHRASNPLNDADEGQLLALRFGPFELDVRSGELRRNGTTVRLQPQPFKVLLLLACRPGDVVTREEVQAEVWPAGTFVDFEQSLNFCVRQIRSALGDNANAPRYVETLPRRGYRWVGGAVERVTAPAAVREWPRPVPAEPRDPVAEEPPARGRLHLPEPRGRGRASPPRARPPGPRPSRRSPPSRRGRRSRRARPRRRSRRPSSASPSVAGRWAPPASAPDGQVVYSAAWDGRPPRPPRRRPGPGDSRAPRHRQRAGRGGLASGEVAFLRQGVLARAPLSGGPPKEVLKGVVAADWTAGRRRLRGRARGREGPAGSSSPWGASSPTVGAGEPPAALARRAPRGDRRAPDPRRRPRARRDPRPRRAGAWPRPAEWASLDGIAWAPDGREVWLTASEVGADNSVHALSLDGRVRPVLAGMGRLVLHDVAPDGRVAPRAGDAALRGALPPRRGGGGPRPLVARLLRGRGDLPRRRHDPLLRERAGRRAGLHHVPAPDGRLAPRARRLRARARPLPGRGLGALRQPRQARPPRPDAHRARRDPEDPAARRRGARGGRLRRRRPARLRHREGRAGPPGHLARRPRRQRAAQAAPAGGPDPLQDTFSPDGSRFVASCPEGGLPCFYDTVAGRPVPVPGVAEGVVSIGFDARGRLYFRDFSKRMPETLLRLDPATGRATPLARARADATARARSASWACTSPRAETRGRTA